MSSRDLLSLCRYVISELPDYMLILLDEEGRIRTWNRGAQVLLGYEEQEVIGKHFRLIFIEEDARNGAPELELKTAIEQGRAGDRRWHKRKDGSIFFTDGLTTRIDDPEGEIRFAKIGRDATAEHRSSTQLAQVEAITQLAYRASSVEALLQGLTNHLCTVFGSDLAAILLLEPGGRELVVRATCGLEEEMKQRSAVPVGEGFSGLVASAGEPLIWNSPDPSAFVSDILRAKSPAAIMGVPLRIHGDLVGVLHVSSTADHTFTDDDLQLLQVAGDRVAIAVDNARLLDSERQARERSAFLADASSVLSSGLDYEKTLADLVELSVPKLADWCAVDVADDRGRLRRLAVSHRDPDKIALAHELHEKHPPRPDSSILYKVLRSSEAELIEELSDTLLRQYAVDDEHAESIASLGIRSLMIVPLCSHTNTFGTLTFAYADSSRRYTRDDLSFAVQLASRAGIAIDNAKLFREAKLATEARDVFMATLSHEMRAPMTSILGWVQMLRSGGVDDETFSIALESIEQSARVQAGLVEDLLDVSRVIAGKLRLARELVDLRSVVSEVVVSLQPSAAEAGVHMSPPDGNGPVHVEGDAARLRQVFTNLVSNALKFTGRGGLISVQITITGQDVHVSITDTGRGIHQELLPHIFEPFRQEAGMDEPKFGGLGLGLAIVKNLVELHDGRVTAESEGPGKGSTFRVRLPLAADVPETGLQSQTDTTG